jgi:hypothetical protein
MKPLEILGYSSFQVAQITGTCYSLLVAEEENMGKVELQVAQLATI